MTTTTETRTLPSSDGVEIAKLLNDRKFRFTSQIVDLAQIDADASIRNQARLLAVHQETVDLYRAAMEAGDTFPPIVLNGTKRPYVVLDGNHRLFAARLAGFTSLRAFVVTTGNPAQLELFTYEANTRHGLPTTIEERLRQAVYLVSIGNSATTTAHALALPERRVHDAVAVDRVRRTLDRLNLKLPELSDSTLRRISAVHSVPVLERFAKLIIAARIGASEISEIVTAINATTSEAAAFVVIAEAEARYAPQVRATAGGRLDLPKNLRRLQMAMRLIRNVDTAALGREARTTDPELRAIVSREVVSGLSALIASAGILKG